MTSANDPKKKVRRNPQARGVARREQLLAAAVTLLKERDVDDISLADVAAQAGIPVASSYNFYPSINAVFAQLMVNYSHQFADECEAGIDVDRARDWQEIVADLCHRAVDFFGQHKAYERIRLSGKAPGEIRYNEERERGVDLAPRIKAMIERAFILPALPDADRPLVIMLDIVDGIFTSEYIREGRLGSAIAEEARRAACAYLKLYIPEYLPRRLAVDSARAITETDNE